MTKRFILPIASAMALLALTGVSQAAIVDIAQNGGFESGDFTGWAQYPSGGTTQTITTTNPAGGTYAANLNIPAGAGAVNNVLKQERLLDGTGLLSAGDIISYSFDVRGSAADGGVLFLENFCETDNFLCGQDLFQLNPTENWQTFNGNFALGAGVTAYTMQFAAVCGASTTTCTWSSISGAARSLDGGWKKWSPWTTAPSCSKPPVPSCASTPKVSCRAYPVSGSIPFG